MKEMDAKDWSKEVSKQIAVTKTDKALLELCDNLKPTSKRFPAHIHASGEEEDGKSRSLIRLNMLDYSKGTGDYTVSVYANISPEEAKYIYSALFCHLDEFDFIQEKIFGEPDDQGYSTVTKLLISRRETDQSGKKRNYPWYVDIQNGVGISVKNTNGGRYCKKDSYECQKQVKMFLNDRDMFVLFSRAEAYIRAFEMENTFRQNRVGNFTSLYQLIKKEIQNLNVAAETYEGPVSYRKAG